MQMEEFLRTVTALPGLTGNEGVVADYIQEAFRPYCDDTRIDLMHSVIALKKGAGEGKRPVVMCAAHLDEIGLMVTDIEEDGALRIGSVGGVDSRILPGMRVTVYGKEKLMGVIGAKSPHILTAEEREKNYDRKSLYIDVGMPPEKVRELVHVGDCVALEAKFTKLLNGRFATKTADDRACVAIMLKAAELLCGMKHKADIYFVSTCQEEVGSYGALTAGYAVAPDYGVALDVCHASTPGATQDDTFKLDSLCASVGPYINPLLRKKLAEVAKRQNVALQTGVDEYYTGTDADELGETRGGVPTVLLELPLKYMHTSVETFDMHTLEEGARLLAHYLAAVDESWEDELWN